MVHNCRRPNPFPDTRLKRMNAACAAAFAALFFGVPVHAAGPVPALPAGTLPVPVIPFSPGANIASSGVATGAQSGGTLNITQSTAAAIIGWRSFNIANGMAVNFDQRDASWAVLNRIYDQNPSVIQGALTARGQVYLINQNGIVFGNGARVDVGALTASSLNISDDLFRNGLLTNALPAQNAAFAAFPNGLPSGMVAVENGAEIRTASGGRVMMLAPTVSNNGVISTPDGQTILAAGAKVYLVASSDASLRGLLVEVDNGGSVENQSLGRIITDRGNTTLVGLSVNQAGRVSATTSVNLNGSIRLLARDTAQTRSLGGGIEIPQGSRYGALTFGAGSITEVLPELASAQTSTDAQTFLPSRVEAAGRSIEMQRNAAIVAPGGNVSLTAQSGFDYRQLGFDTQDGVRIYLDSGARIDVSGTQNVEIAAERNIVAVQLRGNELRDAPLQKDGPLRGKTVYVDVREGTPLADVSGYVGQIGRTVGERAAGGGSVTLRSERDVLLRDGSGIDVSGGSIRYLDGYVKTSRLISQDTLVDISQATPDRVYSGLADTYEVNYARWGITRTFNGLAQKKFSPGYVEGKNAGSIVIQGYGLALDGTLRAAAITGPQQRSAGKQPLGGQLTIDATETGVPLSAYIPDVRFARTATLLDPVFGFGDALPAPWRSEIVLAAPRLIADGFSKLTVSTDGRIVLPAAVNLDVAPAIGAVDRASVSLTGRRLDIDGEIRVPGGAVVLTTIQGAGAPLAASDYGIHVGAGAVISTSGLWVNDSAAINPGIPTERVAIGGGSIALNSQADILLAQGSMLDVSGGALLGANGKLNAGSAGSITLKTGRYQLGDLDPQTSSLLLGGGLRGFALARGGALTIDTSRVILGGTSTAPYELALAPDFFTRGGFASYTINGQDGVRVADGASISPVQQNWVLRSGYAAQATTNGIAGLAGVRLLPQETRSAASISLIARGKAQGDITIGHDGYLGTDPTGNISLTAANQLTVYGTLEAPGGSITLATPLATSADGYAPGQSIWLGADSRLLARGVVKRTPNGQGLALGNVLNGGTVNVSAGLGYVIAETGALIDVSGTSGVLDVPNGAAGGRGYATRVVAGDAGSIALAAQEGILFDGSLRAPPGAGGTAAGGSLSVTLYPRVTNNATFPTGPSRIVIAPNGSFVPAGLHPGDTVDANAFDSAASTLSHRALLSSATITAGKFDSVSFTSPDFVEFAGNVSLATRRSISFDALSIGASAGTTVQIASSYVSMASTSGFTPKPTLAGNAHLIVDGNLIDFEGALTLQGFSRSAFHSNGDIRLKGEFVPNDPTRLSGSLASAGDIEFRTAQLYPTTMSQFTIEVRDNPQGRIAVLPGAAPTPVMSAGGALTMKAAVIEQQGTVKAPFGSIVLAASDRIQLAQGSLTAVSGDGQQVLYGRTDLSGRSYVYALDPSTFITLTSAPEKQVRLDAPNVSLGIGAKVDVSGGGNLRAYEFTPGPGGSKDVLDPANSPNTFAILPGANPAFAPYDHQEYKAGTVQVALKPGDSVTLSGANGVPAGTYTLLPARYALLPGAYLVTPVAGTQDISAAQSRTLADGSQIVAGRFTATAYDGSLIASARSSGFLVRPGSAARMQSEFRDTFASTYFTSGALPGDAGRLSILAAQTLTLDGSLIGAHASGFSGSKVDISAPKIAVIDTAGTADGFVQVEASRLNALGADSLLLGGVREADGSNFALTVGANEVQIRNTASNPLRVPEVLFAATDRVTVADGAHVEALGVPASRVGDLVIAAQADGNLSPGALLRVSGADQMSVARAGTRPAGLTRGLVEVGAGAVLAGNSLLFDATADTRIDSGATLSARALSLAAGTISVGESAPASNGLVLTGPLAAQLQQVQRLGLRSYGTIDFHGNAILGGIDTHTGAPILAQLDIDAAGLAGFGTAGQVATIRAGELHLTNSTGVAFGSVPTGTGTLDIQIGTLVIGAGTKTLAGFGSVTLAATRDLRFEGSGSLAIAAATQLSAARITADAGAIHSVDAGTNALVFAQPASTAAATRDNAAGSEITFSAGSIAGAPRVELAGGRAILRASTGDATLGAGSIIDVGGIDTPIGGTHFYTPAGRIELSALAGAVRLDSGAALLLRGAGGGGDAGTLKIVSRDAASIDGTLAAGAGIGYRGGVANFDVGSFADFSALSARLGSAGFNGAQTLRVRSGDLTVAAGDTVRAQQISLSADAGSLTVSGTLDASGTRGGSIALSGSNGLELQSGSRVRATASAAGGRGGRVELASGAGTLALDSGATIDVSAGTSGIGGSVSLRASRTSSGAGNDVAIAPVGATLTGASEIVVEAVKVYDGFSSIGSTTAAGRLAFATVTGDNATFMGNAAAILARLGVGANSSFHLRPGVEIRSNGDLTLASDWNLYSAARAGGEPGVLTLRAAGNLLLNGSLSDGFSTIPPATGTPSASAFALQSGASWSYRLVGGADLLAADVRATIASPNQGDVVIGAGKLVRTGTGSIDIAAGRDLRLASTSSLIYTAGEPGPTLPGFSPPSFSAIENGRSVFNVQAVYPTSGGDIRIAAVRDLKGAASRQLITDWLYRRTVGSDSSGKYVNPQTTWWPRFQTFQQGIGALGGGDVTLAAGGNVDNVSAVIPTNGRLGGDKTASPDVGNLVVQGGGDLTVSAGGDVLGGVYYVGRGAGRLSVEGGVKAGVSLDGPTGSLPVHTVLALGDARVAVQANQGVDLETAFNPTLLHQLANLAQNQHSSFSTYSQSAALSLESHAGDVTLWNNSGAALGFYAPQIFGTNGNANLDGLTLFPGTLRVAAAGDINVKAPFALYPALGSNFELLAANSVNVGGAITMLDADPRRLPQIVAPARDFSETVFQGGGRPDAGVVTHSDPPLHGADSDPARIVAGTGDIVFADFAPLTLSKRALVQAGRDIRDINLTAQNTQASDVTTVAAGRDVLISAIAGTNTAGIQIGGPGRLDVLAGRNIDLGNSAGIVSRGNLDNPFLPQGGATIVAMAGLGKGSDGQVRLPDFGGLYVGESVQAFRDSLNVPLDAASLALVLEALRQLYGDNFNAFSPAQQSALARALFFDQIRRSGREAVTTRDYSRGYRAIDGLFPATEASGRPIAYSGDINLFFSQIKTEQGGDIELFAPGGLVNAGLANSGRLAKSAAQLGVVTVDGGSIHSYSRGDFLVNQSRVFTIAGGDILLWSSDGNIDAGKGAKTATATPPPQLKVDKDGRFFFDITGSIQGSGIGVLLGKPGVIPGDVDLIAPKGEVNAGDAGIRAAGNLTIAAVQVVGADNISVGGRTAGVALNDTGALGGSLASAGNVASDATKSTEQVTRGLAEGAQASQALQAAFKPSFITVEVLGFGEEK